MREKKDYFFVRQNVKLRPKAQYIINNILDLLIVEINIGYFYLNYLIDYTIKYLRVTD